jgi:hypothetical protein
MTRLAALDRRALRLEYLAVGWSIVEGVVAIVAALAAGSVALLGFGIDSLGMTVFVGREAVEAGRGEEEE